MRMQDKLNWKINPITEPAYILVSYKISNKPSWNETSKSNMTRSLLNIWTIFILLCEKIYDILKLEMACLYRRIIWHILKIDVDFISLQIMAH